MYDLSNPPDPDKITEDEVMILEKSHGALIYGRKYKGMGHKYEVCSEYPSLMSSTQHK